MTWSGEPFGGDAEASDGGGYVLVGCRAPGDTAAALRRLRHRRAREAGGSRRVATGATRLRRPGAAGRPARAAAPAGGTGRGVRPAARGVGLVGRAGCAGAAPLAYGRDWRQPRA